MMMAYVFTFYHSHPRLCFALMIVGFLVLMGSGLEDCSRPNNRPGCDY